MDSQIILFSASETAKCGEYTECSAAKISPLDSPLLLDQPLLLVFTIIHVNKNLMLSEIVFDITVEIKMHSLDVKILFSKQYVELKKTHMLWTDH